jgi:hypothetical protein
MRGGGMRGGGMRGSGERGGGMVGGGMGGGGMRGGGMRGGGITRRRMVSYECSVHFRSGVTGVCTQQSASRGGKEAYGGTGGETCGILDSTLKRHKVLKQNAAG